MEHGSEIKKQLGRQGLTGTSKFGTLWFVQPSEGGRTVCLGIRSIDPVSGYWMHLTPDQARAMAGALVDMSDKVNG